MLLIAFEDGLLSNLDLHPPWWVWLTLGAFTVAAFIVGKLWGMKPLAYGRRGSVNTAFTYLSVTYALMTLACVGIAEKHADSRTNGWLHFMLLFFCAFCIVVNIIGDYCAKKRKGKSKSQ